MSCATHTHTNFEHHAHTNDSALDPDYQVHTKSSLDFLRRYIMKSQPGSASNDSYAAAMQRRGNGHMLLDALAFNLVCLGILFTLAWSAYALEAALLWWLPKY